MVQVISIQLGSRNSWMHYFNPTNYWLNHAHFTFLKISNLEVWFELELCVIRIMKWMCKTKFTSISVIWLTRSPDSNHNRDLKFGAPLWLCGSNDIILWLESWLESKVKILVFIFWFKSFSHFTRIIIFSVDSKQYYLSKVFV